ncbi:DUF4382 domain-containing protein [Marinimicrobium alkaliphilum]|uniref:DUF4382 domain-containing protein n=1 Tax=Marinimicrobium alkaliphilum TaxID=2202654 RepID=UPI000DB9F301|nr:DUF4382 domain-containing protein [Marinimicrobium alkaliphilum]
MTIKNFAQTSLVALAVLGLSACGGSSSSNDDGNTGTLSLSVTDAPVDSATAVVVSFSGVTLQHSNGERVDFVFDEAREIDLLQLQGNASEGLLDNEEVLAGDYEWIRLDVNVERGVRDSYITLDDGTEHELWIPSGEQTGLKLVSGMTVAAGGTADFTIDFDLRKAVVAPGAPGGPVAGPGYMLRPALRLVNNLEVGSISGVIDDQVVAGLCDNAGTNAGAVYVYSGADVEPMDVRDEETDPLITALVSADDYSYEVGFLTEGTYTVSYTCDAINDDPAEADELTFAGTANVEVVAGEDSEHDITDDLDEGEEEA